jgi:hypothetical protein
MTHHYVVKWSAGSTEYPQEPYQTEGEALARVKELFVAHGDKAVIAEIYQNADVLYGPLILRKWHRGQIQLTGG